MTTYSVSPQKLKRFAPGAKKEILDILADQSLYTDYDIVGIRVPHFLAQTFHETKWNVLMENLNYAVPALLSKFSRERISEEQAKQVGRVDAFENGKKVVKQVADQEAIANIIYGGPWGVRHLGNTEPGDGWLCRGAGILQLTGRANFQRFADLKNLTFEEVIKYIRTPKGAVESAFAYWRWRGVNMQADIDNVLGVTKLVNGGTLGLPERRELTAQAKKIFGN